MLPSFFLCLLPGCFWKAALEAQDLLQDVVGCDGVLRSGSNGAVVFYGLHETALLQKFCLLLQEQLQQVRPQLLG